MSEQPLSVAVADTFKALGETPGIAAADPVEAILGEVDAVLGAYRSPEQQEADRQAEDQAAEAASVAWRQPVEIAPDKLDAVLKDNLGTRGLAYSLGTEGMGFASRALSAIPKDVLHIMDDLGAFGTGATWQVMRDLGAALAVQGQPLDPLPQHELAAEDVADAFDLAGLPADAADSLALLLNSLPPATLAALEGLPSDPRLLELGVTLGRKLWGFEPPRKESTMATTTRRPPANADDLVRQAKKLQGSPAYYNTADPDHAKVRQTVTRLYQAANPQPKEAGQ